MTRPVYILNKNKKVQYIGEPADYTTMFGDDYHFVQKAGSLEISSLSIGGILSYKKIPIGIVAVDQTITKDDSIRVMALRNMDSLHPKVGTTNISNSTNNYMPLMSIGFNCRNDSSLFVFTGPYGESYNSNKTFIDGWHDHKVLIDASDYYMTNYNSTWQDARGWRTLSTIPDTFGTAAAGETNRKHSVAAICSWHFDPTNDGYTQGYWYVPSQHELSIIANNTYKSTINNTFAALNSQYGSSLCSSTIPYNTKSGTSGTHWGSCHKHNTS
jgi:hypothetical protein